MLLQREKRHRFVTRFVHDDIYLFLSCNFAIDRDCRCIGEIAQIPFGALQCLRKPLTVEQIFSARLPAAFRMGIMLLCINFPFSKVFLRLFSFIRTHISQIQSKSLIFSLLCSFSGRKRHIFSAFQGIIHNIMLDFD